ncbi:HTH-type transcriptional regulator CdhR [Methylobacterium gnaphalii]|uniref:Transcriptional regulator n=2 Tax=Methylobacterium gnaphalii TaxID=1010610 RepID=A0A512JR14_9HYPH|nr:DJ-1/PfpI family protein [Methylobacterium gnaphalii]GEP12389.1 transcriptional regulator [Methylobacterium gnaphalii]GJD71169.1 HTH-type transcriptional regulator CdhR [Methylobacterium gnaphalii]GLS51553.1 transcriptional regulator [Methylobacterium gnaphalii]
MLDRSVAIIIHDGVQALDIAGPVDVFAEANSLLGGRASYRTVLVARTRDPIVASNGMRLLADLTFTEAQNPFSIVLVAGGPELPVSPPDEELSAWLRTASSRADLYGSICTGAFALGHAGLLDGRAATTHWQIAQRLAVLFPNARIDPDRIHLRDGRLITSAGVTAGIDLALALVAEDHGAALAQAAAKRLLVIAQRQGGQSQFSPFLATAVDTASPLARVQQHVMEHLAEPLSVRQLAGVAKTSERTLWRLFKEVGLTPHDFVEAARVDAARNLLEGSDRPLKAVAYDCGFGTPERMRAVFQRRLSISPAQYRNSFRMRPNANAA